MTPDAPIGSRKSRVTRAIWEWLQNGTRSLVSGIRDWYRGTKVLGRVIESDHLVIFVDDRYDQPPMAKALRVVGHFWLNHWKWIIGVVVIPLLIALYVSQ